MTICQQQLRQKAGNKWIGSEEKLQTKVFLSTSNLDNSDNLQKKMGSIGGIQFIQLNYQVAS